MKIADLHESPFTFRERLLSAFLAGVFTGIALSLITLAITRAVQ